VAVTGTADHVKADTTAYSYSHPEDIPALARSIRETLTTVKGAAPHWHENKSERSQHERLELAIPIGEYGVSASTTTSLMAEAMLSILAIKMKDAVNKGLVVASQSRRFRMNWFATTAAGNCDCQHPVLKTHR
jgi:hypothetical protein